MNKRPLKDLKYIVIHHSVTPETYTVDQLRQLHKNNGYSDVGYHYLLYRTGIKPGRDINNVGAHAITEKEPYLSNDATMNYCGIGVCCVGNFEKNPPDEEQVKAYAAAVKHIADKFKIPLDRKHILPHSKVSFTACPCKAYEPICKQLGI